MVANIGQFCDLETNKYNGYDISYDLIKYMNSIYDSNKINNIIRQPDTFLNFEKEVFDNYIININLQKTKRLTQK